MVCGPPPFGLNDSDMLAVDSVESLWTSMPRLMIEGLYRHQRMQPSDRAQPSLSELDVFRKRYVRRRLAALVAGAVWVFVVLGVVVTGRAATTIGETSIIGTWLVAAGVILSVWRCPRCGELFGRRLRVARCPHCYLALEHGSPLPTP